MNSKIIQHFQVRDPRIFQLLSSIPLEDIIPVSPKDFFVHLCRNIIGQQLSGKAADTIYARFESLFPSRSVTPQAVYVMPDTLLRAAGISGSKISYLKDLSRQVSQRIVDITLLPTMSDEQVIATLTGIKGIGPWTAEMFLIFTLGRPDIFSLGDLGLKRAIQKLYGLPKEPTKSQLIKLTKHWSPYRSYASRILWRYKDGI